MPSPRHIRAQPLGYYLRRLECVDCWEAWPRRLERLTCEVAGDRRHRGRNRLWVGFLHSRMVSDDLVRRRAPCIVTLGAEWLLVPAYTSPPLPNRDDSVQRSD
jgi:hypothetical protein